MKIVASFIAPRQTVTAIIVISFSGTWERIALKNGFVKNTNPISSANLSQLVCFVIICPISVFNVMLFISLSISSLFLVSASTLTEMIAVFFVHNNIYYFYLIVI